MTEDSQRAPHPVALTIAGSDSGGGAGIQADLKTFAALGVFGTSAITCITAQNPDEVRGVAAIEPDMVALQIAAVCEGFSVAAAKTGMLYSASIIRAVALAVDRHGPFALVVDPVMVSTSGARLLKEDAIDTLCEVLLPVATVMTPNLPEAEILCGHAIETVSDLGAAAAELSEKFGVACVVKGGHLAIGGPDDGESASVVDVLCCGGELTVLSAPWVFARETHGTGCSFSAALAAGLAMGLGLAAAVRDAQAFVGNALAHPWQLGKHQPLGI